ncbi:hypothetical protein LUZ60_003619 [Juncus effusus]|nr:hypothetical protein LUZ60_003619 [Juncus effusus]
MSLVAYDDSSSESEEEKEEEEDEEEVSAALEAPPELPPPSLNLNSMMTSSNQGSNTAPTSFIPSLDELPDAAFLFSSPSNPPAQNTSRKREPNGNIIQPQSKIPRGGQSTLVHVRNVHGRGPTTMLVPPQLSGRSNVVTEDIDKLFVNRRRNSTG